MIVSLIPCLHGAKYLDRDQDHNLDGYLDSDPEDATIYTVHSLFNIIKSVKTGFIVQSLFDGPEMSDREPTRWQHNRIYPYPTNPCVYTYDSLCH